MHTVHLTRSLIQISSTITARRPSNFFSNLSRLSLSTKSLINHKKTHKIHLMASADDVAKHGFDREEMYSTNLAGTVDSYDRHIFLCYKSPEEWPARVEASDEDPLPKLLANAIKSRKNDITLKTKVTICGGGEGVDGDVYVFPDNVKYKSLKESNVDGFVQDVLVEGKPWSSGELSNIGGSFVFVCAHGSRDKRCGVCGPELIKRLQEEIELRGLGSEVFVSPCSHVGGHKYAGNLIIVTPNSEGKSICNWYGYVTPDDVPELLDNHIAKGEIIERLWRGKMGPAAEEGETGEVQEVPSGQEADKSVKLNGESNGQVSNIATGCCGGANGVACCQDPIPETNGDKDTEEVHEKKEQDKVSVLGRQFEQREIITAAAVVGALATVAIAYGIYRRSG